MQQTRPTGPDAGSVFLLVVGIVGVSMSGPLMAAATAVPALAMSLWRTGLGAGVMSVLGARTARAGLLALSRRDLVWCCVSGLTLALHFAAWTTSLKYTSVASATAIVCLQVAWVVLIARMSGSTIVRRVWVGLLVALAGVLVVSGVDFSVSTRALTGDGLALLGGIFAAGYTVIGSQVRGRVPTTTYTLVCYGTSALSLLLACLVGGVQIWGFDTRSWVLILAVTLAAQILGHTIFNHLLATLSPTLVSMAILLEVPGAALLAAVFLGQAPPVAVYAGLLLICSGLAIVVSGRSRQATPLEAPID